MEMQSPIFVHDNQISFTQGPSSDYKHAGRVDIVPIGTGLTGYRCKDITAVYAWSHNGMGKGFSQMLLCKFEGLESDFNMLAKTMSNSHAKCLVLLPRKGKPCVLSGSHSSCEFIEGAVNEPMSFSLVWDYSSVPFPYYEGRVNIVDCTVHELIERIYRTTT